jgi:hypothetical protein
MCLKWVLGKCKTQLDKNCDQCQALKTAALKLYCSVGNSIQLYSSISNNDIKTVHWHLQQRYYNCTAVLATATLQLYIRISNSDITTICALALATATLQLYVH